MPRVITHGQVRRQSESELYAVAVDNLTFPTLPEVGPLPPTGTAGTLTTKTVPNTPYTVAPAPPPQVPPNQTIVYEDSNTQNTVYMRVASVVGPAKYNIVVL
ncbi:hypothetical protein Rpal_1288 [Rhodopseudomonas palustris TIE-1]|uniref:hypothetical protein n=1 Tax=Rhodopseudomonas palustris TaxID=1076 RepID=UPI000164B134|nr:hypothetical protein [Rhodopseudomonas palustris]ACE99827.1 hypothetical protein Rpal_1288 [Rhodopseudomonas palustris TIE-1]